MFVKKLIVFVVKIGLLFVGVVVEWDIVVCNLCLDFFVVKMGCVYVNFLNFRGCGVLVWVGMCGGGNGNEYMLMG